MTNLSRTESPRRGGRNKSNHDKVHRVFRFDTLLASRSLAPTNFTRKLALQRLAVVVLLIRSTTGITTPSSVCTRKRDESFTDGISSSRWSEQVQPRQAAAHGGGGARRAAREGRRPRGSGPVPYEHSVQLHHRGSIILPIDDQIGPIYTVYKTEYYDAKTIFQTT
ncbi:hypothetical protein F511_28335 [Dorcoceras hygrometricum]|uniref:Uncharacterized protein n=1 Tax=Dorcoceras hygrometricum TaxID=472368 RepID=A0A2Z7B236_9LAMI|nr:hypothetical protein F511_28335 [Dorcoceras hygrometricum]